MEKHADRHADKKGHENDISCCLISGSELNSNEKKYRKGCLLLKVSKLIYVMTLCARYGHGGLR
jgi:hypothetical protein